MLDTLEPAPTGLITALLGRVRPAASEITEAIGPSPRQMRELIEGRGLFSPYKIGRVAALTRIPETAIRDALARVQELVDQLDLREGGDAEHPRLGRCEVISSGPEITVRTESGNVIEGIHPVSFAGPDLLDRFGLTPTPLEGETARTTSALTAASSGKALPRTGKPATQPAIQPEPVRGEDHAATIITPDPEVQKETPIMSGEPDSEPAIPVEVSTAAIVSVLLVCEPERTDPRDALRDLVAASGVSQAALSRALGRDTSFLSGILTRGRRMPEELPDQIRALTRSAGADTPELGAPDIAQLAPDVIDMGEPAPLQAEQEIPVEICMAAICDEEPVRISARHEVREEATQEVTGRLIVLEQPPSGADTQGADAMEVIIEGVCRVRVPRGFDMEAAARLIRLVSAPFRSAPAPV